MTKFNAAESGCWLELSVGSEQPRPLENEKDFVSGEAMELGDGFLIFERDFE